MVQRGIVGCGGVDHATAHASVDVDDMRRRTSVLASGIAAVRVGDTDVGSGILGRRAGVSAPIACETGVHAGVAGPRISVAGVGSFQAALAVDAHGTFDALIMVDACLT